MKKIKKEVGEYLFCFDNTPVKDRVGVFICPSDDSRIDCDSIGYHSPNIVIALNRYGVSDVGNGVFNITITPCLTKEEIIKDLEARCGWTYDKDLMESGSRYAY